jgi:hypothetical protein
VAAIYVGWHRVQGDITVNLSGVKGVFEGFNSFEVFVFAAEEVDELDRAA